MVNRTVGARLVNDGTLYAQEPTTIDDGFDEVTQSTHKFTKTNIKNGILSKDKRTPIPSVLIINVIRKILLMELAILKLSML